MNVLLAAAPIGPLWWPLAVLGISVGLIVFLITVLRMHAFLALILAAFTAGLLAWPGTLPPAAGGSASHWVRAIELTTAEFGTTAGKIGVVIALASVIGFCLLESGGADKVVRRFLAVFGQRRAGLALLASSYIISIPIFFDTFFMLVVPLAKALRLRLGRDYLLYVMAICCAGSVTHSMIAPHPGPLAMAETLKLDLGLTLVAGLLAGILPVGGAWLVAHWLNRRFEVPLRDVPGSTLDELRQIAELREDMLPSFVASILPIIVPVVLIGGASILAALGGAVQYPRLFPWIEFAGNRNVALCVGAALAMVLLARQRGYSVARICERIGPSFETAGTIILITAAGGAFGLMLKNAGVGDAIRTIAEGREVNYLWLAYAVACVIRIAQGSATVAMLTTAAMMLPIVESGAGLPYHPVYLFLAIGFGAMIMSWMNDSGFWVVSRLSGFTEKETLRSWTVVVTVNSFLGMLVTWAASMVLPLK
ncbi:MAG TPA: SLC13 family permease [Candidatus Paceibacterota bacterium]|nr:hypothetical protein [Verrucomicrobiota bacterium]HOX03552.1 SLC13 family permease [Verrucomicrobiota bacterium]HRZ46441.1 SLC13 family permease [Candidatus Paceibacterota bacterium]